MSGIDNPHEPTGTGTSGIDRLSWRRGPGADVLLRGAHVLDPRADIDGPHDVVIRGGEVAELAGPGEASGDGLEVVEAEGLHALPAFFDPHVHLRTPGREDEEDLETGSRAAAAGGFAGILAMANTEPAVDSASVLGSLRERAEREASVPIGFLANVTRGMRGEELTEMADLRDAGAIGFTDDGLPLRSARIMRRALQYQRLCGGVIALHEEDPELSGDGVMHEGEVSAALGMAAIPGISESTMIARDAALALYEQGRVHVQHLSAAESVQAVEAAKAAGAPLTCEVTPHHLTLTDDAVRSLDARFKMNPPLRGEADRQALIEALGAGTIDCIATDHAPHSADEKEVPFEQAAMGVTGLETAFAVLHTDLVLPGVLPLDLVVDRMSAGAALFDLPLPSIQPGSPANVALVDLSAEWEVGAEGYESRSQNSCFAGRTLTGRVLMTIAAGDVAFRQRSFAIGAAA
jgi:dihydroorotase